MDTRAVIVDLRENSSLAEGATGASLVELATINLLESIIAANEGGLRLVSYAIEPDSKVELEFQG